MTKNIRELLKLAHDHGFQSANLGIVEYSKEDSFKAFLFQQKIPVNSSLEIKQQEAVKAQELVKAGHALREIAEILGYNSAESIRKLILKHNPDGYIPRQHPKARPKKPVK